MWWVWWTACVQEPEWVGTCDCPDAEICVSNGVAGCVSPPEECGARWEGTCDLMEIPDECAAVLCGWDMADTGLLRNTVSAECWEVDGVVERHFDCDAVYTP